METTRNTPADTAESPVPAPGSAPGLTQALRRKAKVAIAFVDRFADLMLLAAIARIIEGMTGNAHFPDPAPALATLAAARQAFEAAVTGNNRTRPAVVRRDNARAALAAIVRDLALYVQHTSQGDLQVLLTSGFPAQRGRGTRVGRMPAPADVRARPGVASGEVVARCKRERDAVSYQWRYATAAAPDAWTLLDPAARASVTLTGLVRGIDYVVQVRAIGASGPSDWSGAARVMAM